MSTRPAGPVPQISNQPRQANTLNLRHGTANQSPTSFRKSHALRSSKPGAGQVQQITHACEWGAPSPPARTFIVTRTAMVTHARTFTAMATRSLSMAHARPCSYLYGLCARPRQRPGTLLTRPAYGSHGSSANHSNALRLRNTSADLRVQPVLKTPGGHGHGVAWRRGVNGDCGVDDKGGGTPLHV